MTMHLLSPLSYSFLCPPSFIYLNFLVQTDRPWYSLQFILSSWQLRHCFLLIRLALSLTLSLIHTVTLSDSLSLTQNNSLSRSLAHSLFPHVSDLLSFSISHSLCNTLLPPQQCRPGWGKERGSHQGQRCSRWRSSEHHKRRRSPHLDISDYTQIQRVRCSFNESYVTMERYVQLAEVEVMRTLLIEIKKSSIDWVQSDLVHSAL